MINKFKVNNELQCLLVTYKTERRNKLVCNWTCCNSFPSRFLNRIKANFDKNEFNITKLKFSNGLSQFEYFSVLFSFAAVLFCFFGKGCSRALARLPVTVACPSLPYLTPTVLNHSIHLSPWMFRVEHSCKIRVCL